MWVRILKININIKSEKINMATQEKNGIEEIAKSIAHVNETTQSYAQGLKN